MSFKRLSWSLAKGQQDGHSLMLRYRQIDQVFPKEKYPLRVSFSCPFHEQRQNGLPTEQEYERLDILEESLLDAAEEEQESILAMIITSSGKREFVFHTADASILNKRIQTAYLDNDYELYYQAEEDNEWQFVQEYLPKN